MLLENTRFGNIEIDHGKIIRLVRCLPGFTGRKRFVLLDREESRPFVWLQSVEDPSLAFVLVDPFLFMPEYRPDLRAVPDETGWENADRSDFSVFVVVNAARGGPGKITANLMAPIVIHNRRLEGLQVICQDSPYSHNHSLVETG